MKSEKHLNKREEIIDTAFTVWHRNCFTSTSLNEIAEPLGMTKQAIYRYFNGKTGLITAMGERITESYRENYHLIEPVVKTEPKIRAVKAFILNQISFFRSHGEYLSFLVSKIRSADEGRKNFMQILREQNNLLGTVWNLQTTEVNYIFNLIVFYIFAETDRSDEELSDRIYTIISRGFGTELLKMPENPRRIIEENRLEENEYKEENRVLQAISEIVMEDGPHNASLDKIAKRAGMTKSSLYFYFSNKEEMIVKTINGHTERFCRYYHDRVSAYSEAGEQLFAHFVLSAGMTIEMPRTVSMIHWFIRRGIADNFRKPTDFENYRVFFENAVNSRHLDTHGVSADRLIMLVNFCVTFEIVNEQNRDLDKDSKYGLVTKLFEIFIHGLKNIKGE